MSYYNEALDLRAKLEKILADEDMELTIHETYPITFVISRNQAPEAQMAFLDMTDGKDSAPDFTLRFIFDLEGLEIQTTSRLRMDDDLMSKIKSLAKKWHAAYTHAYFAERSTAARLPDLLDKYSEKKEAEDEFPAEGVDPFAEFMDDDGDASGLLDDE